jgi:cytochrome c-type biogenesis protein CcmH/NrfG
VCLVVGLALGYLFRGSQSPAARVTATEATSPVPAGGMGGPAPTLDQMKHMADVKAQPLLDKLKTDPANSDLLIQVATVYRSAHQFKEASAYYEKSLRINPKDVTIRTEMASCLYYDGNVDGALAQLEQSLKDDPKNANALFNLGMIRLDAKKDPKGAVSAWQQLLKLNPALEDDKKAAVEKMIAEARAGNKS